MLCGSNDIDDSDDDDQFMVMGPFILNHIVGSRFRGAGFGSVSLELGLRFERATLLRACSFRVPGQENWKLVLEGRKDIEAGLLIPVVDQQRTAEQRFRGRQSRGCQVRRFQRGAVQEDSHVCRRTEGKLCGARVQERV